MRLFCTVFLFSLFISCQKETTINHNFSEVSIEFLLQDSISVRAIDMINDSLVGFGYNKGYGFIDLHTGKSTLKPFLLKDTIQGKNWVTEQRAVAHTPTSFFSLSIGSPARLRKIDLKTLEEKIVYQEDHPKIFYDSMIFWNDLEGIAMGDPTDGCLSVLITRDGGDSWNKVDCTNLPKAVEGEAAFAASNGNISIVGDHTWIVSGGKKSRVFYSSDKGRTWEVFETPIIQGTETTGAYSCHFYDEQQGMIFGGDYTKPKANLTNKAITNDGGKTWRLIADGQEPNYKSCIRYIPNAGGKEMVAVGFTGMSISNDGGEHWKALDPTSFYTIRFINDSVAIAAGKYKIAKLLFK